MAGPIDYDPEGRRVDQCNCCSRQSPPQVSRGSPAIRCPISSRGHSFVACLGKGAAWLMSGAHSLTTARLASAVPIRCQDVELWVAPEGAINVKTDFPIRSLSLWPRVFLG
jgi:hypothetical protein